MDVSSMFQRAWDQPNEVVVLDHVIGVETDEGRPARPEVLLDPELGEEVEMKSDKKGRHQSGPRSRNCQDQRLKGRSEGREEIEADDSG